MLLTDEGIPSAPPDITTRLHRIDPKLDLKFVPRFDGNWWGVVARWEENDPRRRFIQSGDMATDSDFDLVCYIPLDCPADNVPPYIENVLRRGGRPDINKLVEGLHRYNKGVGDIAVDALANEFANTGIANVASMAKASRHAPSSSRVIGGQHSKQR